MASSAFFRLLDSFFLEERSRTSASWVFLDFFFLLVYYLMTLKVLPRFILVYDYPVPLAVLKSILLLAGFRIAV
jgi:hypothetical protein